MRTLDCERASSPRCRKLSSVAGFFSARSSGLVALRHEIGGTTVARRAGGQDLASLVELRKVGVVAARPHRLTGVASSGSLIGSLATEVAAARAPAAESTAR